MPAVVLALMRAMRSPESLSESSLSACLRLVVAFCFVTGALASTSESLELTDDNFLEVVLDGGLGLEKASAMDGCFTSTRKGQTNQAPYAD